MKDEVIIQRLDRLERLLKTLVNDKKPDQWVKASDILRITGETKEWLRQRRRDGTIKWKKNANGFFYEVTSLPSIFIRHENERSISTLKS